MKQDEFVEYVMKLLVNNPDQIKVQIKEGETTNVIEVRAALEDYGKIIGRRGRLINAVRILLGVISRDSDKRWVIDVPDKGERAPSPSPSSE